MHIDTKNKSVLNGTPDKIFINGPVLTMDRAFSIQQAIALKGDQIIAAGKKNRILALGNNKTRLIDLQGRALLPGFIDPHSHFLRTGLYDQFMINLASPPLGDIRDMGELIQRIRQASDTLPEDEWIFGYMYDDTLLSEQRHPTAQDLDKATSRHPVFLRHISGHLAAVNSLALKRLHITQDTVCPLGGTISKDSSGKPNGLLQGEPAIEIAENLLPEWTREQCLKGVERASEIYAAKGVTTAQEGDAFPGDLDLLFDAQARGLLKPRVQVYPNWNFQDELKKYPFPDRGTRLTKDKMISLGGIKLYQDGSIQAYSGYLSRPYHQYLPGTENGFLGRPRHTPEDLNTIVARAHRQGWQIAVHANGDQAIEEVINAMEKAQAKYRRTDCRHIIIHCQTVREDQLDRMAALGIIPSFFTPHIYFWGDRHREIFLGPERARRIDPCKSAVDRGMAFTCHNDTYITPMDPLLSVWAAVNRLSYGGDCLGPEFKISVSHALRSVTCHAAYQAGEEQIKGSLEPGKLADLVILEDNPLDVLPERIKDIGISQTICGGHPIF